MKNNLFLKKYFSIISNNLFQIDKKNFQFFLDMILGIKKQNKKIIIVGNGGSAAMASHVAVDFTKAANVRAINFNEADLITCYANDYGYENWVTQALKSYAEPKDLIILISSSGKSKNITNAAKFLVERKMKFVTFSGFSKNNHLKKIGKINFWVDSKHYNIIEMTHHIWLLAAVDKISKIKI